MQFKVLASTTALAAALAFAGPAAAQTTINGAVVPENELPAVQQRCDDLKNAADTASLASGGATDDELVENAGDAEVEDAPEPVGTAEATTTTVDLSLLDLEACVDAGLVSE